MNKATKLVLLTAAALIVLPAMAGKPVKTPSTSTPYMFDATGAPIGPVIGFDFGSTGGQIVPTILMTFGDYGTYRVKTEVPVDQFSFFTGVIVYDVYGCQSGHEYLYIDPSQVAEKVPFIREINFLKSSGGEELSGVPLDAYNGQINEFGVFVPGDGELGYVRSQVGADGICVNYDSNPYSFYRTHRLLVRIDMGIVYPMKMAY